MQKNGFGYSFLESAALGRKNAVSVGKSWLMRDIYALFLGIGKKKVFVSGDFSAGSPYISEILTDIWIKAGRAFSENMSFYSFKIPFLLNKVKICILPMPNPDGCELYLHGLSDFNPFYSRILRFAPDKNFECLRANARGAEPELNFSERWTFAKEEERQNRILGPSLFGYGGEYPESEKESAAVSLFLRRFMPDIAVVFRRGEKHLFCRNDSSRCIGNLISSYGRIPYMETKEQNGGFSLWLREFFKIPVIDIYLQANGDSVNESCAAAAIMLSASAVSK